MMMTETTDLGAGATLPRKQALALRVLLVRVWQWVRA